MQRNYEKMQRKAEKCRKMQINAGKCWEIKRNNVKCKEMQGNSAECSEMQRNAVKCREMQWNIVKYSEMQWNAAVLHQILGAVADHWSLGVKAIFHLSLGIIAVHHMPWRQGSTRRCQARASPPQGSGRDSGWQGHREVIERFLDKIIINSNDVDIIVTSTMLSCIKCNALNNQGGTHGSDEL